MILAATGIGRHVGATTGSFLLYYAGVFVLLALTGTVVIGLVATDRIIMSPERRVTAQAVHRAVATGALAFLIIHIVSEIAVGRSQPADAVIPFLDQGRTFYLGLGTVASDLMVVIAVTGIFRARLASTMSPVAWRAVHGTAYASWLMGIAHGLLAGRTAHPFFGSAGFVPWSYGACVAFVGVALVVRFVAKDRAAEHAIAQPVPERPAPSWPPAAGPPVLGQPAFGATPLAVSPARPLQRALPAPPAAAPVKVPAALPAGRGQAADGNESGHGEPRAAYASDGTGVHFGNDMGDYQDGTRGRYGQVNAYRQDDIRVPVSQEGARVYFGNDTRGRYGQDDTRDGYPPGDPRGGYSRDDVRGSYPPDDPGGYGQDGTRGGYGRDDVRGGYPPGDPGGGYGQDGTRGGYGRDVVRGGYLPGDPGGDYGRGDTRGGDQPGDMRGGYGRDDTRGGYPQGDPRGGYGRGDTRGGGQPGDMRGGYGRDDTRGGYPQGDPRGGYGRGDTRGGGQPGDMRGGYGRDDARGYPPGDMRGYPPGDPRGGYGRDDARGGYPRGDMRGGYGPDDTGGHYDQDDPRGYYGQEQGSSFEEDYADHEVTGPLPAIPFARYGTRP